MLCFIVSYRGVQFVQTPVCTYVPKFLEVDIQQLKDLLNWVFMTFCLLLKCSNYLSLSEMIFSDKFIELYALLMILIALMFETFYILKILSQFNNVCNWWLQCKVCMQTFMCTTSEVKCREHAEAKHPKSDLHTCFPHLKNWTYGGSHVETP